MIPSLFDTFSNELKIYKRFSELSSKIDYEMDEMDHRWLQIINLERAKLKLRTVPITNFEFLMDRFEKESHFVVQLNNKTNDHEVICSICRKKQNEISNCILNCYMCQLKIHKKCYGIMYTPRNRWFCRRCLYSPSIPVYCIFCPLKDGAFIQTEDNKWAHILCAFWIPEVYFENTVLLEKVKNIKGIPQFRKQLNCYVCNYRGKYSGICLQCNEIKCVKAYHVICAQEANLHMRLTSQNGKQIITTYCHLHSPFGKENRVENESKINAARRILRYKRNTIPIIATPKITTERLKSIVSQIYGNYDGIVSKDIRKYSDFVTKLYAYWNLKRKSRNGVPMLSQIHSAYRISQVDNKFYDEETICQRIHHWRKVEENLNKLKELCDLIRTIEEYKYDLIKNYFKMIRSVIENTTSWGNLQTNIIQIRDRLYEVLEKKKIYIEWTLPNYLLQCNYPHLHITQTERVIGNVSKDKNFKLAENTENLTSFEKPPETETEKRISAENKFNLGTHQQNNENSTQRLPSSKKNETSINKRQNIKKDCKRKQIKIPETVKPHKKLKIQIN